MQVTVHNRGPDAARAPPPAAALVPQHLVLEARAPSRPTLSRRRRRRDRASSTRDARRLRLSLRRRARAAVLRERDQRPPALRRRRRQGYFKDGINDYVVDGRRGRREPGRAAAPRPRPTTGSTVPAGGSAPRPRCGCADAPSCRPVRRLRRRSFAQRRAEADEFYADAAGRTSPTRTRGCVQRQAFAGHDLEQAVLPLRRAAMAATATRRSRRRRPSAHARPQRRLAAPQQRRHHLDAGQVGVSLVRRLGPGLPLRRRWR